VAISASLAVGWVGRLLGSGDSEAGAGTDRKLSHLEHALLADIVAATARAMASAAGEGLALTPGDDVVREAIPFAADGPGEFAAMTFEPADDAGRIVFALASDRFQAVLHPESGGQPDAEAIHRSLERYVARAPVRAVAHVGRTTLLGRDLMALEPGDVVLLETGADDLVEIRVHGRAALYGTLARNDGWYAVQVEERRGDARVDLDQPTEFLFQKTKGGRP
jgi:flagellar motor switch/type III secretory pathway protein FliN